MDSVGFVVAVWMWLLMLSIGATVIFVAVVLGGLWLLVTVFSVMWVVMTLIFAWKIGKTNEEL